MSKKPFKNVNYNNAAMQMQLDLSRFNTQHEKAQWWLDNQVIKDSAPFVPRDTGTLEHSAITGTVKGSGLVVYDAPYARKVYYGDNMNFSQAKHPQACAYWFEAAKAAHKTEWIELVKRKAGGG